ncbi:MAG: hypothetical protein PF436_07955 [Prolixibacteraceae bacterium]|nr:hypothetical protein [Prolixibacteraceae bacterium]
MIKQISFLIFLILLFLGITTKGQDKFGFYVCGVTLHAKGDPNAALMPLKLSSDGKVIFNYGGVLHYKKYFKSRFSFDAVQAIQADCGLQFSSATVFSAGYDIIKRKAHRFIFAIGPGFYIRESWTKFEEYQRINDLTESKNGKWEYKFIPFVPHIEYAFVPEGKNFGFTIYSILDPIENVYNFGAGINYILDND